MLSLVRGTVLALGLVTGFSVAGPALAQDQTLADIRQQLSILYIDVQRLRTELSTTGAVIETVGGVTALDRLNAIEAELQRLTSKTEELEFRINQITVDGTNRIGDLEFRLCELEAGCDISALGDTPMLGGIDSAVSLPTANDPVSNAPALAVGEQADFDQAKAQMVAGDFRGATEGFAAFVLNYPGSPLSAQASYLRGEAFESLGEMTNAARAYLDSFSGDPQGDTAPEALYKLGFSLGAIGQTQEACITLAEVGNRFPGHPAVAEAQSAQRDLGCQ
jgi:tol-pal system protein YbgF